MLPNAISHTPPPRRNSDPVCLCRKHSGTTYCWWYLILLQSRSDRLEHSGTLLHYSNGSLLSFDMHFAISVHYGRASFMSHFRWIGTVYRILAEEALIMRTQKPLCLGSLFISYSHTGALFGNKLQTVALCLIWGSRSRYGYSAAVR